MKLDDLTQPTLDSILDALHLELLKRGFTAPIRWEKSTRKDASIRLDVLSDPFQTVPVIFQSIAISSSNIGIVQRPDGCRFGGTLCVSYTHFDGGSNGCQLFHFDIPVWEHSETIGRIATY